MREVVKPGCFILLFLMIGCTHIPFFGKTAQPADETVESGKLEHPMPLGGFVEKGQIVDAEILKQGGNIAVIPFNAGVNVEANEELEQIALMLVKGVADVFAEDRSSLFRILTAENLEEADFIIQGHVTDVKGPSKAGRWIMLKGHKMLSVEGKMIDVHGGEAIAVFADQATSQTENYQDLGYHIGKNIGLFIVSGAD